MTYALVTGSSKGIGKAMATELAKKKINLLLVARSADALQQLSKELKATYAIEADYLATDLSLPNAAETVYNWCTEKNYSIHILINNAGYGLSGLFENEPAAKNVNMMQLNMVTPVQLCHIFLPMLKQNQQSYILNIASSAAYQAVPYLSLYSASKSFVLSFSRGLANELKGSPVSVTCVCPGPTDTDFNRRASLNEKATKAAEKFSVTPEEVGAIAVKAMFARKRELIVGFINKLSAFGAWLLPKSLIENTAAGIYK